MLEAIDNLPEDEARSVLPGAGPGNDADRGRPAPGCLSVTVKRRLFRGLRLLTEKLADLSPGEVSDEVEP